MADACNTGISELLRQEIKDLIASKVNKKRLKIYVTTEKEFIAVMGNREF